MVLSHGAKNVVCGTDGQKVEVEEVRRKVNGVRSLYGKPKQGNARDVGGTCDDVEEESDSLVGIATQPEYVSFHSPSYGTYFIQSLVYILAKFSYKDELQEVNTESVLLVKIPFI